MFRPLLIALWLSVLASHAAEKPNIIFILADDLGYGELGCYGQKLIKTPNLDRMAEEGMRFRQFYAGSTVCAPSRAVLMTGLHTGHVSVRGNAGAKDISDLAALRPQTLREDELTVAELLKKAGYSTALIGKWGLGELGSGGEPTRKGFDYFFGYLNQSHAHNYYPAWLTRGTERVALRNEGPGSGPFGASVATKKLDYSPDLFAQEALEWVAQKKDEPFFLYLALTTPHANNEAGKSLGNGQEVPDLGIYADTKWTPQNKAQAAMITRMDADIGRLFAQLKALGIDEKTLVFFSSDNGPHKEGGNDPDFFRASGSYRGIKRALTEGGIRVPFIARWPGHIPAGTSSGHIGYFGDLMATLADITGTKPPKRHDSISFLPTLLGKPADEQEDHEFLYWEFHEGGTQQAALYLGRFKGIRQRPGGPLSVYNIVTDSGETRDISRQQSNVTAILESYLATARSESADWPILDPSTKKRTQPPVAAADDP
jgi:uncharacterized sulfatase